MPTVKRPLAAPAPARQPMQRPKPGPQQLGSPMSGPTSGPGWSEGGPPTQAPLTPDQKYSGHAQYDPALFELWKQQHPNDSRQYAGPGALPPELAQKWYANKGNELRQQQVVHDYNRGGGTTTTTPGHVPQFTDPNVSTDPAYWLAQGKNWYDKRGAPFLPGGGAPAGKGGGAPTGKPAAAATSGPLTGLAKAAAPLAPGEAPASNATLGQWFAAVKPGQKVVLQGKTYFKNQNGAVVDVTDPKARKRITNRQGAFIGQAAAPPPPGTTPPGTTPPATTPPGREPIGNQPPPTAPPSELDQLRQQLQQMQQQFQQFGGGGQQYPPTNQPQQQYDPSSLNQFGYPQNQGPGPYGWNPGYGGSPFNYSNSNPYSNFSNALMQGMGGGGSGSFMQIPSDYAMGMMGGGDPYGGMGGGYGWPEAQMGMGMSNEMMGYNAGMDPYGGQQMMGYY